MRDYGASILMASAFLTFGQVAVGQPGNGSPSTTDNPKLTGKPLYDAFRAFCLSTHADAELINKAIKISKFYVGPDKSISAPVLAANRFTAWPLMFEDHKLGLTTGKFSVPISTPPLNDEACGITSSDNEAASVGALLTWLGQSDSIMQSHPYFKFSFELNGEKPTNPKTLNKGDSAALDAALASGGFWSIEVRPKKNAGVLAILNHFTRASLN